MTAAASTHVRVMVDHTLPIQLRRSTKLKISHWFYWSVSLAHQVFIPLSKSIVLLHFLLTIFQWDVHFQW